MARAINRLSSRFVQTVKTPGRYADGMGLYLKVDPPPKKVDSPPKPDAVGAKRWVFMFTWEGGRREMGLGSAGVGGTGVGDARDLAEAARGLLKAGLNPIEERRKPPPVVAEARTFGEVAEGLVGDLAGSWKSAKHEKQWSASLKTHAAVIWKTPVADVDTEAVLLALRPIWSRIPETASRVRGRIEHVLDAARVQGEISGPWENPARWKGHLARLLGKRQTLSRGHHAALPFADIPAFMADLRARDAMSAVALEFTILTVARTGETIGATLGEIDRKAGLWSIGGERMKAGRPHRVPLSPRALELVASVWPDTVDPAAPLFPGPKGKRLSNMAMDMLLRRMGRDAITVHGFRSCFRDWAGESTNFPRDVVEAALAHVVGDQTERAYRRGDALLKRRRLMEAWAGYCARPVGGNVRQLGRAVGGAL